MSRASTVALLLTAALPLAAQAQGSLSTQGFGYPTGQLSTRAMGAGGATGEIDPLSASNPAALLAFGGPILYFQADPEYRTLHVGNATERTSVARYPLVVAGIPITPNALLGISASNLLDRSFQNITRVTSSIGDANILSTNTFNSNGAIADIRVGLAYGVLDWLKVGVGVHAITGDNRVSNTQQFDDSVRFARLVDTATVNYSGSAFSGGFEAIAARQLSIAGSYKHGNGLTLARGDSAITHARVPDHMALSVAYLGIRGSSIAVRTSKDTWSNMNGLGSTNVRIVDGWDTSVGADILGPHLGDHPFQLRGGYRTRTLPFSTATSSVTENTASVGTGTFIGRGRGTADLTILHANRMAGSGISETAWTISFGVSVRP